MIYGVNDEYMEKLIMQFIEAIGAKNVDINSKEFLSEFLDWLKSRRHSSYAYLRLLDDYELLDVARDFSTAEIGKGKYDTITKCFDTTIITPYTQGLDESRTISGELKIYDGKPTLVSHSRNGVVSLDSITPSDVNAYMTQNPYTEGCISNWDQLHNGGNAIMVGVYGSIYDKDIDQKIQMLDRLRERIPDTLLESTTFRDDYCAVLASKIKLKRKVMTK